MHRRLADATLRSNDGFDLAIILLPTAMGPRCDWRTHPHLFGMDVITVEPVASATDEVRTLIEALDLTLAREYRPEQRHGLSLDTIFQAHVRFFIARIDGVAMGCGGVALFATFAEVKRMYVRERARGRGVGVALLKRFESETKRTGIELLRLETGTRQSAAIRLYERAGFQRCDAFGDYASMAAEAIETSLFFEKRLTVGVD